jgi:mRNA interferase RelE/StbE
VANYSLKIKPSAAKELETLPKKDRQRVAARIQALATNPRPPGCEKLSGQDNLYRVRQGDYRILYTVDDRALLIVVYKIGHRREVYR